MKSINIIIVTYCQQNVIGRALDSVLSQKEYGLNNIIVCDDCSPDNNWEVISTYVEKYPLIIKAYRNEKNLGIYGNLNYAMTKRGEADLFYIMAGDDALKNGWFKRIQKYITDRRVDISLPIGIFGNWENVYPNGNRITMFKNKNIEKYNLLGLFIRGLMSLRTTMVSSAAWKDFEEVDLTQGGGFAEAEFNRRLLCGIEKAYYLDYVGTEYYCGIGVSADIESFDPDYFTKTLIRTNEYVLENYIDNQKDAEFIRSKICASKFIMKPSLMLLMESMYKYYIGMKGYKTGFRAFFHYYRTIISLSIKKNKKT